MSEVLCLLEICATKATQVSLLQLILIVSTRARPALHSVTYGTAPRARGANSHASAMLLKAFEVSEVRRFGGGRNKEIRNKPHQECCRCEEERKEDRMNR